MFIFTLLAINAWRNAFITIIRFLARTAEGIPTENDSILRFCD
jgi:hypothetical protein